MFVKFEFSFKFQYIVLVTINIFWNKIKGITHLIKHKFHEDHHQAINYKYLFPKDTIWTRSIQLFYLSVWLRLWLRLMRNELKQVIWFMTLLLLLSLPLPFLWIHLDGKHLRQRFSLRPHQWDDCKFPFP